MWLGHEKSRAMFTGSDVYIDLLMTVDFAEMHREITEGCTQHDMEGNMARRET